MIEKKNKKKNKKTKQKQSKKYSQKTKNRIVSNGYQSKDNWWQNEQKLFKNMSVVNLQNMIKFQKIIILGFLSNLNKNLFLEM